MKIESGIGNGKWAAVDRRNRLEVRAETFAYQQIVAIEEGQTYQVEGIADLVNGTAVALHIKNTSTDKNLVVDNVVHQVVADSDTAYPSSTNYFTIRRGRARSTGGTVATAVNTNAGSGNQAQITAYQDNPTLTGSPTDIDRWYTRNNADRNVIDNEGALIIVPGQTLEFSYVGTAGGGVIFVNVSFSMIDI